MPNKNDDGLSDKPHSKVESKNKSVAKATEGREIASKLISKGSEKFEMKIVLDALNQAKLQKFLDRKWSDTLISEEKEKNAQLESYYETQLEALRLVNTQMEVFTQSEKKRLNSKIEHLENLLSREIKNKELEQKKVDETLITFKNRLSSNLAIYQEMIDKLSRNNDENMLLCNKQAEGLVAAEKELLDVKSRNKINEKLQHENTMLERGAFSYLLKMILPLVDNNDELTDEIRELVKLQDEKALNISESELKEQSKKLVEKISRSPKDFFSALDDYEAEQKGIATEEIEKIVEDEKKKLEAHNDEISKVYDLKRENQELRRQIIDLKQEVSKLLQEQKGEQVRRIYAIKIRDAQKLLFDNQVEFIKESLEVEKNQHKNDVKKLQSLLDREISEHQKDNKRLNESLKKERDDHKSQMIRLVQSPKGTMH